MKIGAVVVAAGLSSRMKAFKPMLELAGSTIIKKTIASLHSADIADIAVVVGHKGKELAKHLSAEGVTIVENPAYCNGEMFCSACLGLAAMQDYDILLFLPADIPLFAGTTARLLVEEMHRSGCAFVSPQHGGKKGHPIAINGRMVHTLLQYSGNEGLRGAIQCCTGEHRVIVVDDPGILLDADCPQDYKRLQSYAQSLACGMQVSLHVTAELVREVPFWDNLLNTLLQGVEQTGSLNKSCTQAGVSYSKGWGAIKQAQHRLGIPLLNTSAGGANGGGAEVTPEAWVLIDAYNAMTSELEQVAQQLFQKHYSGVFFQKDNQ